MTENESADADVRADGDRDDADADVRADGDRDDADAGARSGDGESDADGVGYRRLESELEAFGAEFESLVEHAQTRAEAVDGTPAWATRGRALLDQADAALAAGKIEQGWRYLHAAERLGTYGLEAIGEPEALAGEARELLVEAANAALGWRSDAVRERLTTTNGTLRETLTWTDLRSALELLHDGYESVHLKRQHLQAQFRYLSTFAAVAILVFLVVAMASPAVGVLPSPFVDFSAAQPDTTADGSGVVAPDTAANATASPSAAAAAPPAEPVGVLVYVVLAGVLGASLFGLWSLRHQPISGTTPQYLTAWQAAVTRIVVGAGSALAVFFFVRSGVLPVAVAASVDSGPFLISIAFVAGYSERLVHATVESVASKAGDETVENE